MRLPANDAGHPSSFAYGTASDLANLVLVHLNSGRFQGSHYLSPHLLEEMQREHTSRRIAGAAHPLAHVSSGYGLGLMTGHYRGQRVLRHGGMVLSYNCFFELLPEAGCGFVLLTNAAVEERLMELVVFLYDELLDLPHQGVEPLPAPEPIAIAGEQQRWPAYEGVFLNVEWGSLVEIAHRRGRLFLLQDGDELPLICIGPGEYYGVTDGGRRLPVAFVGKGQRVQHIMVAGQPYHRHRQESIAADGQRLQALSGSYRDPYNMNDEEVLHLRYRRGQLWLHEGEGDEYLCEPLSELAFRCALGFFELVEDPAGMTPMLIQGKAIRYRRVETG